MFSLLLMPAESPTPALLISRKRGADHPDWDDGSCSERGSVSYCPGYEDETSREKICDHDHETQRIYVIMNMSIDCCSLICHFEAWDLLLLSRSNKGFCKVSTYRVTTVRCLTRLKSI